jgi:hypothetical protein
MDIDRKIGILAAEGWSPADIATHLGISVGELNADHADALKRGPLNVEAELLIKQHEIAASSNDHRVIAPVARRTARRKAAATSPKRLSKPVRDNATATRFPGCFDDHEWLAAEERHRRELTPENRACYDRWVRILEGRNLPPIEVEK